MAYQRFAFAKSNMPPATVATIATLRGENAPNVATVATVARAPGNSSALPDLERAAILEADGGVPAVFAAAFAALMATCPDGVPEGRWWQAIDDAAWFLDQWGEKAVSFGWSAADLFDRAESGVHGLLWELAGRVVVALTEDGAMLGEDDRTLRAWYARSMGRELQ